jgi:glycosyltransferase involved in cell wall biosynthesis
MKVFWFHSGLMPAACRELGYDVRVSCGWLESMLNALLTVDPGIEFCLLGWDPRPCDVLIGRVRHVSFGSGGLTWYKKIPEAFQAKARQLIAEFRPDIIHVQGTEYFYGCFDPDVYGGHPVVVSIQGLISGIYPHYMGGISPRELRGTNWNARYFLKGRSLQSEQTVWREGRAEQEQRVLRQQMNFIGRTDWDRATVAYYNPKARYFTVNENLREPFFKIRRHRSKIRRHSIYCSAAASTAMKGAHWLIRAVAALKGDFPDIELRIAAANGLHAPKGLKARLNDQSYFAYLRRLVRELGVERQIHALPPIPAERVVEELQAAELFVLPSLCENSPNSLGEAMLGGTPSIATFVGGVPSILKDGVEGKLIPSGDPAALAGAIRRWFDHPEEAEEGVETARKTAFARHDAHQNALDTLKVYQELGD